MSETLSVLMGIDPVQVPNCDFCLQPLGEALERCSVYPPDHSPNADQRHRVACVRCTRKALDALLYIDQPHEAWRAAQPPEVWTDPSPGGTVLMVSKGKALTERDLPPYFKSIP